MNQWRAVSLVIVAAFVGLLASFIAAPKQSEMRQPRAVEIDT